MMQQIDESRFSEQWPRQMRAETAARYVDEKSVEAFRRATGIGATQGRRTGRHPHPT